MIVYSPAHNIVYGAAVFQGLSIGLTLTQGTWEFSRLTKKAACCLAILMSSAFVFGLYLPLILVFQTTLSDTLKVVGIAGFMNLFPSLYACGLVFVSFPCTQQRSENHISSNPSETAYELEEVEESEPTRDISSSATARNWRLSLDRAGIMIGFSQL